MKSVLAMVKLILMLFVSFLAESGARAGTPNATIHLLTLVPLAETVGSQVPPSFPSLAAHPDVTHVRKDTKPSPAFPY